MRKLTEKQQKFLDVLFEEAGGSLVAGECQLTATDSAGGTYYVGRIGPNWIEIGFGVKTEILNNLFLGIELQLKNLIYQKNKNDIANFYIPGFNRTYEGSNFGTGFNYSLTYLIPIIKK